uniref:Cytochrome P450 n=1 Tax=Oryza glumipatula TaxID=40148 RepID=A0A0E0BN51_9ORYZ
MELLFSSQQWLALLPPIILCILLFSYVYIILWLRPERLRQKLRSQGVRGPKPSFLFGNIPEMRRIQQLAKSAHEQEAGSTDMYLPTRSNRGIWNLDSSIRTLILNISKKYEHDSSTSVNKDLLHSIIQGSKDGPFASCTPEDFIVDNCKNIYFAGHETTSTTAAWCLMLLASHHEWQSRARVESLDICQGRPLDFDILRKLKKLTMVIQETLRLYPPASFVAREALNDMKLGGIDIPKGTNIRIPIAMAHRDPSVWGPSADKFDPDRFANGIAGACKPPHMYMPFGVGVRTCAGQNLAMVELKVVLSLLLSKRYKLQRFHFTMYYHWALNRCRSIIFPDNSYMISIHDDKIEKFSTLKNRTGISSAQNNTRLDKNWR